MLDLGPKQSRNAIIIGLLLYGAAMAGLSAWLIFKSEDTVQRRLSQTPGVTVTLAGKEPLVPDSWKKTPEKEADALMKDVEKVDQQPGDVTVTEPAVAPTPETATPPADTPPVEPAKEEPKAPAETPAPQVEAPQAEIPQTASPSDVVVAPDAQTAFSVPPASTAPVLRWQRFARPFDQTIIKPRIAIIIADLGLASAATQTAVQELPGEVSLAFSSSAPDLESWIAKARAAGHEAILAVPMEPENYPQNDPGPNTLLTGLDNKENVGRVRWALARSDGYVGVMPYMGEKFVTVENKLAPVLDVIKEQGLMVIDSTHNRNSLISPLSRLGRIPFARSDAVIDLAASRVAIEAQLEQLERTAQEKGYAIGIALPYPVTFEKLKAWIPTLEQKGFVLAPVTALASEQTATQATETSAPVDPAAVEQTAPQAMPEAAPPAIPATTPTTPAAEADPNRVNNELVQ